MEAKLQSFPSAVKIPTLPLAEERIRTRRHYRRRITFEGDTVVKLLDKGVSAKRQKVLSEAMPDLLVPILDIGEIVEKFRYRGTTTLGDTIDYIVMPKLNPIADIDMIPLEKYRHLLPQILEKVDKLHSLGYIHGDLAINNILVDNGLQSEADGKVYLSDLDTMISRNEIKENPALFTELLESHSYRGNDIDGFMAYERAMLIEDFSNV